MTNTTKLDWQNVRWRCQLSDLDFDTTNDIKPIVNIIGQQEALDALEYSIESRAFGQNAFVRGLHGTGRLNMICEFLHNCKPNVHTIYDQCYVANFSQPDRPKLLTLKAGDAKLFKRSMKTFADYITKDLNTNIESQTLKKEKTVLENKAQNSINKISNPFEAELSKLQLKLVNMKTDNGYQSIISPVIDGKPIEPQQWQELIKQGKITQKQQKKVQKDIVTFTAKLQDMLKDINTIKLDVTEDIQELIEKRTRNILTTKTTAIYKKYHTPEVKEYLDELIDDVVEQFFYAQKDKFYPHKRYSVNILISRHQDTGCPIIIERVPSLSKLLGTIESKWGEKGPELSDHMSITAGTLLRADGGFLILDARELLSEPGAWKILIRTLKNQLLEIVPAEMAWPFSQPTLKPEAIPVNVRVIILGNAQTYYLLDNHDPDFPELFKVLVDFDTEIDRNKQNYKNYAAVITRLAKTENLLPFDKSGVAALIEHGARICARKNKLTTNFPRVADLAREGNYLASKEQAKIITAEHVNNAIKRTKLRGGLPSKKFQQMLANGTINLFTSGKQVGEINGLAVIHSGPVVYGFPSRITATVAPGRAGVINIEGHADMSGSIHTKGFAILGGLLRHLLPTTHPLTFSASIAFEQSYGGIDGDSASGAEFCCLISAITGMPITQEYAMTGAIDQHGRLQAIGGVNEKIEGFFDTCKAQGFTGTQGVIIPLANAGDLMLRYDVQQAVKEGKFTIHAVNQVTQALAILCQQPAGILLNGEYADNTILATAMQQANLFWKNTLQPK
ncbi:MAG: AAA family ATPase [Proteobacteria bacterium]|nr:AAA family ATPase [Pseudomonadota bacterium]